MRPIFNKKVAKKCNLWNREQYTYALFTVDQVNNCGLEKKKKKTWRRNVDVGFNSKQTVTISALVKHKMEYSCYMKVDFSSLNNSTFVIRNNKYATTGTYWKLFLANGLTMFFSKLTNVLMHWQDLDWKISPLL